MFNTQQERDIYDAARAKVRNENLRLDQLNTARTKDLLAKKEVRETAAAELKLAEKELQKKSQEVQEWKDKKAKAVENVYGSLFRYK